MIPAPHGGSLVDRQLPAIAAQRREAELQDLPKLRPDLGQVYDALQIATGAFSPLEGFMDRGTLESVVLTGRLPDGLPWPIPVYLSPPGPANERTVQAVAPGDEIAILDPSDRLVAILHLTEKFRLPKREIEQHVYNTSDATHPDVAALSSTGDLALAGRIDLVRSPLVPLPQYELTPATTRATFRANGWDSVAGYQTRNVPHLGHEHLQRMTLEREDVDALLIHPVVGPLKDGDYRPEIVIAAYQSLIGRYYPSDRVALATLSIAMRYAGPRAALFLAIVRQNFGCSHFIVGRDQAGVGRFYDPYACHRIFDEFPLDILPIRFREFAYCRACQGMVSDRTCGHPKDERISTSQTKVRRALLDHQPLPVEILRPEVAEILRHNDVLRRGEPRYDRPAPDPDPARPAWTPPRRAVGRASSTREFAALG